MHLGQVGRRNERVAVRRNASLPGGVETPTSVSPRSNVSGKRVNLLPAVGSGAACTGKTICLNFLQDITGKVGDYVRILFHFIITKEVVVDKYKKESYRQIVKTV